MHCAEMSDNSGDDHRHFRAIAKQSLQLVFEFQRILSRVEHVVDFRGFGGFGGFRVIGSFGGIESFRWRIVRPLMLGRFGILEFLLEAGHGRFQFLFAEMHAVGVEVTEIV